MEWGRGTGPGPSGKGKDEKRTFFFDGMGDSRCSHLDPWAKSMKTGWFVRYYVKVFLSLLMRISLNY